MDSKILSISWNIATNPKLYRELELNPYSKHSQEIITKTFPKSNTQDVIKAVIYAEPEGRYDMNFKRFGTTLQLAELQKENEVTKSLNLKLIQYCKSHKKELRKLSQEFAYDLLCKLLFESRKSGVVEQKFGQSQRRVLKLAIIHAIEDLKRPRSKHIATVALLSLILCFLISLGFIQIASLHTIQSKNVLSADTSGTYHIQFPVHLIIPSIKVDSKVDGVGITAAGVMEVPDSVTNTGWFNLGPSPGATGSAVIAGHFDGKNGESAVFNNLNKLNPGDRIFVIDNLQNITTFVVRESREFAPGYAEEVFKSQDTKAHLNLVTCDGVWEAGKKSYSKRLVVFADIYKVN